MLEIRKVGVDDLELFAGALAATGRSALAADLFLGDDRAHAFVAMDGAEPIGFAYGYQLIRPEGFWTLLLCEVVVDEDHRRQGAGRELLEAFAAFARSKGHRSMWLFTDAGDDAARRLYEGAGGERGEGASGYRWVFE